MANNSKFFTYLRALTAEELLGFQKYLHRYHGAEVATLKVFAYCKRFHGTKTEETPVDLADIYRKLFKAEMASARKKLLNPLSDLSIWIKEFLLAEKMRDDSWASKMVWMGVLQKHGLQDEFSRLAASTYKEQGRMLPDAIACLQNIACGMYYKRHLIQEKTSPDFQALIDCAESIKQSADILSLKMSCEILNDQRIRPQAPSTKQKPSDQALMLLYQMVYNLLHKGKEADFPRVVTFLDEHLDCLGENEVLTVARMLHNFAAPFFRSAKVTEWNKRLHDLDKILLKKGLYTQNGVMSPTSFCNIVNIASAARETNWARDFIKQNKNLLTEETRLESINLATAIIAFEEKDFKQVLELVENHEIKTLQHVARAKALKLRALYELDPLNDTIEDLCVSFDTYLKRNRSKHPDFVDATRTFLRLFKKLFHQKLSKKMLQEEIEATPQLYFYHWLLEKVEGQKGRNTNQ